MLRITKNKDEIIVRDIPFIRWTVSIAVAFILFLTIFVDFSFNEKKLIELAVPLLIILPIIGFLLYLMSFPATTLKINEGDKIISIRRQSLFKYTFNVHTFNELSNRICVREFIFLRNNCYQLVLPLKDDSQIELSISVNLYKEPLQNKADLLNKYIFDSSK